MEFDPIWLLLALPIAFALGWLASRLDLRQLRAENRRAPSAYFRGLNLLLNEQQDEAIDAFITAMQADPDTAELHFALGNLFRRRGEYLRAVRVHEHLLARADLSAADRDRARWGLAQDFLKAGLLDRAEQALRALAESAYADQALLALLAIYERSRDWPQAQAIAQTLQARGQGDFSSRSAHYLCEQAAAIIQKLPVEPQTPSTQKAVLGRGSALEPDEETPSTQALALLDRAQALAPTAIRPRLARAQLQQRLGDSAAAWESLTQLAQHAPQGLPLAAALMVEVARAIDHEPQACAVLRQHYRTSPQLDVLQALVDLGACLDEGDGQTQNANATGSQWYLRHLEREPSLVAALRWLAPEQPQAVDRPLALPTAVHRALDTAARPLTRYRCAACGFEARQHFWHCPGCQSWDSYPARRVEEL